MWGRSDYSGCLIFLNNFPHCQFKRFFKTSGFCALYLRVYLFVNSASVVTSRPLSLPCHIPHPVFLILSYIFGFHYSERDSFHVLWRVISSSFVYIACIYFLLFLSTLCNLNYCTSHSLKWSCSKLKLKNGPCTTYSEWNSGIWEKMDIFT